MDTIIFIRNPHNPILVLKAPILWLNEEDSTRPHDRRRRRRAKNKGLWLGLGFLGVLGFRA